MEEKKNVHVKENPFEKENMILIALGVVFAGLSLYFSADIVSAVVNIIALILMLAFLLAGMGKLHLKAGPKTGTGPLYACIMDLERLTAHLDELNQAQPSRQIWDTFCEDEEWTYESAELEQALKKMNAEMDALSIDGDYQVDISDYVNEDLISSVGNTDFNDFVSNVMTGLGILGTFVGLAIGLQSFRAETAEAMTNSIVPLIEGIKVAFLTSIFGVTFSLIYGTMYRSCLKRAQHALDNFLDTFYKCQGRRPENDIFSRLLRYEQSQTESMSQFAEDISVALSNAIGETLSPTLTALPEQMSQAVSANLNPMVETMERSLSEFSDRLSSQMSEAQNQGMDTLVEKFLEKMNEMTNGQMENLSRTIETICTWQETTVEKLNEAVSGICSNAASLSKINGDLDNTVARMEMFLSELQKFQEENQNAMLETAKSLIASNENVEQTANKLAEITERSGEIMDAVNKIADSITAQESVLKQAAAEQQAKLQETSTLLNQQVEETRKTSTHLTEALSTAASQMVSASQNMDTQLEAALDRSFKQFDGQLAKALQHFSGTLTELQDVIEGAPQMLDGAVAKMHKSTEEYLKAVADGQYRFMESLEKSITEMTSQIQSVRVEADRQTKEK